MTNSTLRSTIPSTLTRVTSCLLIASLFLALTSPSVTASPLRLRLSLSKRDSIKAADDDGQSKLAFNKRVSDADAAAYAAGIPDAGSWYESALAAGQASQAAAASPSALNNNLLAQSANAAPSQAMLAGSPDANAAAYSAGIPAAGDWYAQQLAAMDASSAAPAAATPAPTPAAQSTPAAAQPSPMVAPLNAAAIAPLRNGVLMQQVPSSDSADAVNIWKNAMAANAQF